MPKQPQSSEIKILSIIQPQPESVLINSDAILIQWILKDTTIKIDSFSIILNSFHIGSTNSLQYLIPAEELKMGKQRISIKAWQNNATITATQVSFTILSALNPLILKYKITATYPHDINAYTQGLCYDNNYLYESTGQYGQSSLRKINIKTGKILQSIKLANEYFAEGLALLSDKLIQLTYKEQVAFIYNKHDFSLISKFNYPNNEGWGLTKYNDNLIMTDGGYTLYFLDTISFTIKNTIDVYDNKGPVYRLNELEIIDNDLFANVYGENYIVRINPKTGQVTGKLNCENLLKPTDYKNNTDVLNGIAYNPIHQKIYITGKNWPKLFEIELIP